MICKLTTTLTGFIYFASSFLFLGRDVALGECEDSLLLDKRANGRPDFCSLSSLPRGKCRQRKRLIWEPPGKDSAQGEPPSLAPDPPAWGPPLGTANGLSETLRMVPWTGVGKASWIITAKKKEAKTTVSSLPCSRKNCVLKAVGCSHRASCLPRFPE